ncbi:uroporphyrinogen-III synthase [Bacteroidota bacterium]
MSPSIFISRNLENNSVLLNGLTKAGWLVASKSLVTITPIPFDLSTFEFDWLFISSSNGAKLVLENYVAHKPMKIGAVGEATAKTITTLGFEPQFIGQSGNMNEVGKQLAKVVGKERVLFAGAKNGSKKTQAFLNKSQVLFVPVYETAPLSKIVIPETDWVFLTSPSNAEAYLTVSSLKGKKVAAIGHTTAEFLAKHGCNHTLIPKSPKETDVLELLLSK